MHALRLTVATLGLASLVTSASPAAADSNAPGSCACDEAPVAASRTGWDGSRWGIGLRATSLALHPDGDPDARSEYAGGGLQLRWRLSARWELEGLVEGLREQLGDGVEGDRQLNAVTLAARYHLRPYSRWDWYLLAGLGATTETTVDGPSPAVLGESGHVHLGAGVERRFGHFGIAAELRMVGMGPTEATDDAPAEPMRGAAVPPDAMSGADAGEGRGGGQLTLAATYHF